VGPLITLLFVGIVLFGGPEPLRALWELLAYGRWSLEALGGAGLLLAFYISLKV
jgi:hypothetical protein